MSKKSGIGVAADLRDALAKAGAKWAKTKKAEEAQPQRVRYRSHRLMREARSISLKDAAYEVMEKAYMKASDNGRLPANARQVMYAARPLVQEKTDERLEDTYFTQTLLPDYLEERN